MQPLVTEVRFGDPHAEMIACAMTIGFFTLAAGLLFYFFTTENSLRNDLKAVAGGQMKPVSKVKAALILALLWILAAGWYYNSSFGDRFYVLERAGQPGAITWKMHYEMPRRTREVADADVAQWTGVVEMSRRSVRYSVSLKLKQGRELQSMPVLLPQFKERAEILKRWGITLPESQPEAPTQP